MTIQEAYKAWQAAMPCDKRVGVQSVTYIHHFKGKQTFRTLPQYDGFCCPIGYLRKDPDTGFIKRYIHKPSCTRENAWRTYVNLRDHAGLDS